MVKQLLTYISVPYAIDTCFLLIGIVHLSMEVAKPQQEVQMYFGWGESSREILGFMKYLGNIWKA